MNINNVPPIWLLLLIIVLWMASITIIELVL
jgi:hypothetical protein